MFIRERLVKLGHRIFREGKKWKGKCGIVSLLCKKAKESGNVESDENDEGSDDGEIDDMAIFAPVLTNARLDTLPEYACNIRRSVLSQDPNNSVQHIDRVCDLGSCRMESPPLYGSYNILFPIRFGDGVKWIVKIPAAGDSERWDQSAARALESEALTMRMLRQKTSMQIPVVHSFGASMENQLGCPFILMDHMDGRPLYEGWFDTAKEDLDSFRRRTLETLAASMAQLTFFNYSQSGALTWDAQGKVQSLGPTRVSDAPNMHSSLFIDGPSNIASFCEVGPFDNVRDFLFCMFNRHRQPEDQFGLGLHQLLRLFIEWIPEGNYGNGEATFGLAHPDYDLQNVLVGEDGTVLGLIDWDGVAAVPRSFGCEGYPKWLTYDWDPFFYNFNTDTGRVDDECGQPEHSLEELAYYRTMYAQFMENSLSKDQCGMGNYTVSDGPYHQPAFSDRSDTTRKSLLIGSLNAAATNPLSTTEVVLNIFEKITQVTAHKRILHESKVLHSKRTDEFVYDPGEEIINAAHEVTPVRPSLGEDDGSNEHNLREMTWGLRYNTADDGTMYKTDRLQESEVQRQDSNSTSTDADPVTTYVKKIRDQQQQKRSNIHAKEISALNMFEKRDTSWTKENWTKIGSLVHKASVRLRSYRRAHGKSPSPDQTLVRPEGLNKEPKCLDGLYGHSHSSQSTSSGRASSLATAGGTSQVTDLTDVSSPDEQERRLCTNDTENANDVVALSIIRAFTLPEQTAVVPGLNSKTEAQGLAQARNEFPGTREATELSPPLPAPAQYRQEMTIRGGKVEPRKSEKLVKESCRFVRVALAKLPYYKRKVKVKDAINPCGNARSDVEEPPAYPIGFGTHKERITAMRKAAAQKCPTGQILAETASTSAQAFPVIQCVHPVGELAVEGSKGAALVADEISKVGTDSMAKASQSATWKEPVSTAPAVYRQDGGPIIGECYIEAGFSAYEVCHALADGTLDETRMRRLKDGFALLLDSF